MRGLAFVACTAALLLSSASVAVADGFYVSGDVGGNSRDQYDFHYLSAQDPLGRSIPYPITGQGQYKIGIDADVAVGYKINLGRLGRARAELGFQFDRYQLDDSFSVSRGTATDNFQFYASDTNVHGANFQSYNTTLNVFYDFTQLGVVIPFVGVGVGDHLGTVTAGSQLRTYTDIVPRAVDASGQVLGPPLYSFTGKTIDDYRSSHLDTGTYLAEVGCSVPVAHGLSVVPAYRYTNEFRGGVPVSVLKLGVRYEF